MKLIKLGEICDVKGGKRLPKNHSLVEDPTSHRYIRAREIKNGRVLKEGAVFIEDNTAEILKRYTVNKDDILITIVGANIGDSALVPSELSGANLTENAVKLCDFRKDTVPQYLNFVLQMRGMKEYMQAFSTGSAQDKLGIYKIKLLKVPFFERSYQEKIVKILSTYDDLIENNNQRIQLLEEMAEEIYREWFVRFRFPGYEEAKFLDKTGNEVAPGTKGAIPLGWEKSRLKHHIKYFRGKSYSSEELRDNNGLAMLNLKNINRQGGFRRDGLKFFEGKFNKNNVAHAGDIVMAVTDMTQNREIVGRVALVPEMGIKKYIISMDLIRIAPIKLPKLFTYSLFRYSGLGFQLKEFANGVNVLHLTPSLLENQKVLIPSLDICLKFEEVMQPIVEEIDLLANKNQILQETRDLLLPRLISGKLSVVGRAKELNPEPLEIQLN